MKAGRRPFIVLVRSALNLENTQSWEALMNRFLVWQSYVLVTLLLGVSIAFSQSSPPASKFIFSTYLGVSGFYEGFSVATDVAGNVYVTGLTTSSVFPGTNSTLTSSGVASVSNSSPIVSVRFPTHIVCTGFTQALRV